MSTKTEIKTAEEIEAVRRAPRIKHSGAILAAALAMTQPYPVDYAPLRDPRPKCADPKKKAKRKMQAASRRRNRKP